MSYRSATNLPLSNGDDTGRPVELEIFSGGVRTDAAGQSRDWTPSDLDEIARSYDPALHEAPAVLGHPVHDDPAVGWVRSIARKGGRLVASLVPTPLLRELVRQGLFRKRSAAFYAPDDPRNPAPGKWYLRHVGFLGGMVPAIKGLADVRFRESGTAVTVEFDGSRREEDARRVLDRLCGAFGGNVPGKTKENETLARALSKEECMQFKEWMKGFLNRAVDSMAEEPAVGFSEGEMNRRIEAEVRKAREELFARFMETGRQEEEKRLKEEHRNRVAQFCDVLGEKGTILPAWEKAGLRNFLERLPFERDTAVCFGEAEPSRTPFEWMCGFLKSLPRSVRFDEVASRRIDDRADDDKTASEQLVELARTVSKAENVAFSEALRRVAQQHPELCNEYRDENRGR